MSEPIFLKGKTLHQRQTMYYNGSRCPYCDGLSELVDSKEVHQESHGWIFLCRKCNAWVGTHSNSPDHSLGFLAKAALRELRIETRKWYDPLWDRKVRQGTEKRKAQSLQRNWIAGVLGISPEEAHIAMMDNDQCNAVIEECKKWHTTAEQREIREQEIQSDKKMVLFLAGDHDFEVKEFNINGTIQLDMKLPKGTYSYRVREKVILKPNVKKWEKMLNIEKFINDTFLKTKKSK